MILPILLHDTVPYGEHLAAKLYGLKQKSLNSSSRDEFKQNNKEIIKTKNIKIVRVN